MKNKVLCLELNDKKEMATAHAQLQEQGSRTLEYGQKNGDVYILLAEGPHFDLDLYDDYSIIDDPHPDLLASYFRLPSPSIEKNLCILKSSSMTQIFKAMNFLLNKYSYSELKSIAQRIHAQWL